MTALDEALRAAQDAQAEVLAAQARLETVIADRDALVLALVEGGFTYAETGALLGLSTPRIGQIVKAHRARLVDSFRSTPAQRLSDAREAFRLARYAQELRCEQSAMGYAAESRAFYGDGNEPASDDAEQRIRWAGFHVGQERERDLAS